MKKTIATTLAALMFGAMTAGTMTPAAAAPYHHATYPKAKVTITVTNHPKHWHKHKWCHRIWRHHQHIKICVWVPNHH